MIACINKSYKLLFSILKSVVFCSQNNYFALFTLLPCYLFWMVWVAQVHLKTAYHPKLPISVGNTSSAHFFFLKTNYFDGSLNAVWNNSKITRPRTKSNLNIFVILAEDVQQEIFSQVSRWRETSIVLHDKQTFPLLSLSWSHTIKTANHINDIQQHIHHASHTSFILMGQFPVFNDTVSLREHS